MYSLLAYIIQVNILLTVVYIGYSVLLKRLTFYRLNRGFFLVGAIFSFVYPFLDIKSLFRRHIEPVGKWMGYLPDFYMQQVAKPVYTLENAIYSCIAVAGLWFAMRLCIQLLSLLRIHIYSRKTVWKTYWYQNVLFPIVPFSFLNKIYLHKEQHQEPELHDIFEHEDIHVKGLHSLDILMFEILLIVCWYNPFVWLMRRAVRQNLEYLTDQQVLNKGVDRQTYQYSLLNVTKQGASLGMSNQFNFKFLKKRIMMMNKKKSSKLELSKYAFLLPIFIFSAGAFTISKADVKITEAAEVVREKRLDSFKAEEKNEGRNNAQQLLKSVIVSTDTIKDEQDTLSREKSTLTVKGLQGEPLYIVDGKRMLSGYDVHELNPNDIERINVWKKSAEAILKYGDEAAKGVVEITTKAKAKEDAGVRKKGLQEKIIDTLNAGIRYREKITSAERVEKFGTVKVRGVKANALDTAKHPVLMFRGLTSDAAPLYVVDGVIQRDGQDVMDTLDPNQIESISVLKDKSATSVYGDKGKNGVLVIATKRKGEGNNASGLRAWSLQTPEPLKNPGYVVDGLMVSKEEYAKIDEGEKKSIVTLSKKEANNYFKFHNRSIDLGTYDGVVMVTTKE
ncbi:M56 family metallopeptidase [Sphingobacterium gobiense]|uniref:Peptidase M56 domain-containing protein n=1 Tax=Sphingobacterium gobiense TaxID=1382456 RepID=A0A2S9JMT6_9SPHI|nr:M56 family metallopeptidase [Sphingobacterium gobiense]PRD54441.1 hypothetical protein C5749_13355 [Sphingobacterium gobiense]